MLLSGKRYKAREMSHFGTALGGKYELFLSDTAGQN
jgi:hypothetical protein